VGRALPAKWQLAAVAAVAFLLYAIFAPVADWLGLRSRPEPEAGRVTGKAAVDRLGRVQSELIEALRELTLDADDAKRERADKLARDYVLVRAAARSARDAASEESEVSKRERKESEEKQYQRVWREFNDLLEDRRTTNAALVDYLEKNLQALSGESAKWAVERFIHRTKTQSGAGRELVLLAREIETLLAAYPGVVAAGGDRNQAEWKVRERIKAYFAARRTLGPVRSVEGAPELMAVKLLPYESGARVLLRHLDVVDEGRILSALFQLRFDLRASPGNDAPLFAELPGIPENSFQKADLQLAIDVIYRDCREPYRERYVAFMKELIRQRMALGRVVDTLPPSHNDSERLLSEAAMPNERMSAAAAILRAGIYTRATAAKLKALPEAVMGKMCPPERHAYGMPR
jgi:hypothetical protein